MTNYIGKKLCEARKKQGISQKQMAILLNKKGVRVTNQAVSKWESGASLPNAVQFLIICDVLNITDIGGLFLGKSGALGAGLNAAGRQRLSEYADMLRDSGLYDDPAVEGPRGTRIRKLPVFDLEQASAKGQLLDSSDYEMMIVGSEVPLCANFGIIVSGESMEPDYINGQVVWITQQPKLEHGEVGVFKYESKYYFKRLRDRVGGTRLQSIDSNYPDVIITNPERMVMYGKVIK